MLFMSRSVFVDSEDPQKGFDRLFTGRDWRKGISRKHNASQSPSVPHLLFPLQSLHPGSQATDWLADRYVTSFKKRKKHSCFKFRIPMTCYISVQMETCLVVLGAKWRNGTPRRTHRVILPRCTLTPLHLKASTAEGQPWPQVMG